MIGKKTIDSFFRKTGSQNVEDCANSEPSTHIGETSTVESEYRPLKSPRVEVEEFDKSTLVRDPALREPILKLPTSRRDEVIRAYLEVGPYQPELPSDQFLKDKNGRRFLTSWYKLFPNWLEYSPTKHCTFCLPCYLFSPEKNRYGSNAFTVHGFSTWKKVNDGKNCAFLAHVGKDLNSSHRRAISQCRDLLNQNIHLEKFVEQQTSVQVARNRLRLKATIDSVKWLTLHNYALRGRDESSTSSNRGNCIDMIEFLASYNPDVHAVVLHNAPQNASYHSGQTQREILSIFRDKIQRFICEEINGGKFCILVDESQDESNREQMAIVLRFVDKDGIVRERFFDIVHVLNTASATLKTEICSVLARHNLNVQNIRGQGYDGASNMRGRWNGLQALFLKECPFA
ncbi:hypothetical protein RHMOL_Rhmol13G0159300 [Rhododendron molle]|uniref:Uncharacterized protein n=1 Tax=Rhododendron molle TaxID=49168 RepID=A0ACC0L7H2_RHOML|nr:hypothetical protein RHMOL_Rhmol13G0159300 [Rhododendron molle]